MTFLKRGAITAGAAIIVAVGAYNLTPTKADFNIDGLNQQVQTHEARLNNNDKDIKKLQDSTNTSPAEDKEVVPAFNVPNETSPTPATSSANTPNPTVTTSETPAPKTTKKVVEVIPTHVMTVNQTNPPTCLYKYDDGSSSVENGTWGPSTVTQNPDGSTNTSAGKIICSKAVGDEVPL